MISRPRDESLNVTSGWAGSPVGQQIKSRSMLVRSVVHPLLEKGGEAWQVSRAMKAHQRELQARELGQNLGQQPGPG